MNRAAVEDFANLSLMENYEKIASDNRRLEEELARYNIYI